ncbi:MAG: C4-dicarboxylate transporter DcuC [Clostridiales bacterium]|nr:C4-dicarboxylate transporter DcuC [Clostridiales bacterium]
MFAYYISTPLKKVKNPYIVGMLVIVIGFIFVCALPSGVSNVVLLFGIIYPIMRSVGLSKRSAISAITIGCAICGYIGPANAVSGLVITQLGDATTMGDLFVTALPYIAIYMVVALIVYFFTARFFDKREAANLKDADPEELKEFDMSQVTRPKWYSVFPLLPLIFVLIFSSLIPGTATMSVVGATFMSFVIVFIIELIQMRQAHETFAEAAIFYKGMGSAFGTATIVGVAGTLFSTALTLVGGINLLAVKFTSLPNMSIAVVLVVFTILHAVMFFITGSGLTCIFTLMPIFYSILTAAGREDLLVPACVCILLVSQSIGQACTPVSAATLFISGATNEAPTTVAKRNALPAICGGVVTLIAIMIFLV